MRCRIGRVLSIILAMVMLNACTSSSKEGSPVIPTNPSRVTTLSQMQDVPLARFSISPEELATFYNANVVLANRCAERFGVDSPMLASHVRLPTEMSVNVSFGSVFMVSDAKKFGYAGNPQALGKYDGETKTGGWSRDPSPREREVLEGKRADGSSSSLKDQSGKVIHEGGCLGEGADELQGGNNYRRSQMELINNGLSESYDGVLKDPTWSRLQQEWSDCMKPKGYSFQEQREAANSVAGSSSAQQRKVAVDDLTCVEKINYFGIVHALDVAYEQRYVDKHAAELKSAHDGVIRALEKAKDVLARR